MEDTKMKTKSKIKKFVKDNSSTVLCVGIASTVGILLGAKIGYKKGFDNGIDAAFNAIVKAGDNNGGLLMAHKTFGDYIFKATKVPEN